MSTCVPKFRHSSLIPTSVSMLVFILQGLTIGLDGGLDKVGVSSCNNGNANPRCAGVHPHDCSTISSCLRHLPRTTPQGHSRPPPQRPQESALPALRQTWPTQRPPPPTHRP